uniref:Iron-binding zinc finger CDGSH type domain-containing protein n=1 Tax=Aplanochytrium stocchinoi TaxID=215587 RepID=A0A7S3LQE8_9STRA|mmetsp:Transcript_3030/g.3840  ORF Transcript_3030/g.3840 Transcript_3030/m.3840 type:complete len:112 (-) Transcript_3030:120-455(-)
MDINELKDLMNNQDLVMGLATGLVSGVTLSLIFLKSCFGSTASGRVNNTVELDKPKVVNSLDMEDIAADGMLIVCRCWKSKSFPLCDGSHVKHNQECGDNVGPCLIRHKKI